MSEFDKKPKPTTKPVIKPVIQPSPTTKPDNGDIKRNRTKRVKGRKRMSLAKRGKARKGRLLEISINDDLVSSNNRNSSPLAVIRAMRSRCVEFRVLDITEDYFIVEYHRETKVEINGAKFKKCTVSVAKQIIPADEINIKFHSARAIQVLAESIDNYAFNDNKNLVHAYLNGVKNIGDNAFNNCYHLKYLYITGSLGKLGANIFDGCDSVIIDYQGTQKQWGELDKHAEWAAGCNLIEIRCINGSLIIKK